MGRPALLVTGFGPFPTMPRNPSATLATRVATSPRWRVLGVDARGRVLTTAYAAIGAELDPALRAGPDALVMIGVAGRSHLVRFETRATSRRSVLFPDAAGETAELAAAASPATARRTTVPTAAALVILRRHGVPARASRDAGRYLCNASYFHALGRMPGAVFVHIPKPRSIRPGPRVRRVRTPDERLAAALVDLAILLLGESRR